MRIINPINSTFSDVVSQQSIADGISCRLLTYCISQPIDNNERLLLYNTLSCEMLLLEKEEIQQILSLPYLKQGWFLVPEDFDDIKFFSQYRDIRLLLNEKIESINGYTIFTTTDCNARCFYCYELGRGRIHMSEEVAAKVSDYIIHNYNAKAVEERKKVKLCWFGGEPLYNHKVIDLICEKLRDADVPYYSTMISNAYLFDEELVSKSVKSWKLRDIQITLDGTEKIYNRSKAFIYKNTNPFELVMANIGLLLDAGIKVSVRLNIDMHNADDLMTLAYILKDRFGDKKIFSCYSHPLYEVTSPTGKLRSSERRAEVYARQKQITELLENLKLKLYPKLLKDIPFNICMADSHQSVVIAPTGQIGLCEHYSESEFFSHIDTPDAKDTATYNKFQERCEDMELCKDCPVYPQCIRLKMCEEGSLCFPEIRQQKTDNIRKAMLAKYERWKLKDDDVDIDADTSSAQAPDDDINENC